MLRKFQLLKTFRVQWRIKSMSRLLRHKILGYSLSFFTIIAYSSLFVDILRQWGHSWSLWHLLTAFFIMLFLGPSYFKSQLWGGYAIYLCNNPHISVWFKVNWPRNNKFPILLTYFLGFVLHYLLILHTFLLIVYPFSGIRTVLITHSSHIPSV